MVRRLFFSLSLYNSATLTASLSISRTLPHLQDSAGAGLHQSQYLVLTAGGQQAAVCVKGHAEDHICVAVDHLHRFTDLKVPDQHLWRCACVCVCVLARACVCVCVCVCV